MNSGQAPSSAKVKVLIVEDSAFYRQALSKILISSSKIEVIGTAWDGTEAIRFVCQNKTDVVLLDLEMQPMDGFTFLRWLMTNQPLPVLIVSGRLDAANVFKALEIGAVDFLAKPTPRASKEIFKIEQELRDKVELVSLVPVEKLRRPPAALRWAPDRTRSSVGPKPAVAAPRPHSGRRGSSDLIKVVAIGASTGGPPAVQAIVTQLPKNFSATVAVAQHMPPDFTRHFAERLDKISEIHVLEGRAGEVVQPGTVYIAPGGYHMAFEIKNDTVVIETRPLTDSDRYAPSVDVLMKSVAEIYGPQALGVLLTGMGQDGKQGMRLIKQKGGDTLAESQETAVVFGMPQEAIREGVVDEVLPLYKIPEGIIRRCL